MKTCTVLILLYSVQYTDASINKELLNMGIRGPHTANENFLKKCNRTGFKYCIYKCCKSNELVMKNKRCSAVKDVKNFTDMAVYRNDLIGLNKTAINDLFEIVPHRFKDNSFLKPAWDLQTFSKLSFYLTETGELVLETPNSYPRFSILHNGMFCLDHKANKFYSQFRTRVWVVIPTPRYYTELPIFKIIAASVSVVCFIIVLAVYNGVRELRNLVGWVLSACVVCLTCPNVWFLCQYIAEQTPNECVLFSSITYYLHLAAYLWMNVMFFDIWWETRSRYKNACTAFDRRGAIFKFIIYGVYAHGLSLIPITFFVVLNSISMTHLPYVVTPRIPDHGCSLNGWHKVFYLHIPLLVLVTINWLFFFATAYLKVCAKRIGNTTFPRLKYRLQTYLKLLVVVTLEQATAMVAETKPEYYQRIDTLADTSLLLLGPIFFMVFVWRRETRPLFIDKLTRIKNSALGAFGRSSRSNDGSHDSMILHSTFELQRRDTITSDLD